MLYADDLCIVTLSSAGLVQCDDYCKKHSITFNVSKSVCMFFKSEVNKKCDNTDMILSGKAIDFVQETKYLGVILNSQLKTSVDVSRQTRKFYAQASMKNCKEETASNHTRCVTIVMLLRNFRYCSDDVKCMLFRSYCTNMYCCPLLFNSTSSSIKKLKASYNGVLRRLLLIVKPYSASEMFVTHGIPSFFELLRKCIYSFKECIDHSSNKIIKACLSPIVFIHSQIRQWWRSVLY